MYARLKTFQERCKSNVEECRWKDWPIEAEGDRGVVSDKAPRASESGRVKEELRMMW